MEVFTILEDNLIRVVLIMIAIAVFIVWKTFRNDPKEINTAAEEDDEYDMKCDVCEEVKDHEDVIEFDTEDAEIGICKSCIDKAYPRKERIVEKEIKVLVEKEETDTSSIDEDMKFAMEDY